MSLLRVGDMLDHWHGTEMALLLEEPGEGGAPIPALFFPLDLPGAVAFVAVMPADFAERDALEGRIYASADAWACWTAP